MLAISLIIINSQSNNASKCCLRRERSRLAVLKWTVITYSSRAIISMRSKELKAVKNDCSLVKAELFGVYNIDYSLLIDVLNGKNTTGYILGL